MFSWLFKKYANYTCLKNGRNSLNILTYHRVSHTFNPFKPREISKTLFKEQLSWLKKYFNVLPLPLALELIENNSLPPRAVCLTIDDGYNDSYHIIFKILKELELTASFFISTKGIEKGSLWDEELSYAFAQMPTTQTSLTILGTTFDVSTYRKRQESLFSLIDLVKYRSLDERAQTIKALVQLTHTGSVPHSFLTPSNILEMHQAGMTIGAHTHQHPILTSETDDVAYLQIEKSKLILEEIIGEPIDYFAYPNGKYEIDFQDKHVEMLKKMGFKAALSTNWGSLNNLSNERYTIKRFTPWDETQMRFCFRLAANFNK